MDARDAAVVVSAGPDRAVVENKSAPNASTTRHTVPKWACLSALAAIGLVSRLPQLVTPNLLLDGDECILGLMARHLADGREFPVFFYGQRYGLSIVEAPAAALSLAIVGDGAVSLKIAMLAIWITGIFFYFLAFSRQLGNARSASIALLLVLMPAWAVSSMKAWSGYVTAFTATAFLLYLIAHDDRSRTASWTAVGVLTSVVYFAQPLWLPGILPILLFFLLSSPEPSSWRSYLTGLIGALAVALSISLLPLTNASASWPGPAIGNPQLLASLPALLDQIVVNLTGSYYLNARVPAGPATSTVAYAWVGVLVVVLLLQIYRVTTKRYLLWSHLLFASVLSTCAANWSLLGSRDARYLLPISAPLAFLAGIELFAFADRGRLSKLFCSVSMLLLLALETVSMSEFSRFTNMWWNNAADGPTEARTLKKVIGYMESRGVSHAFSMNALLQWQVMFYSGEGIVARWMASPDRYPQYVHEVDRALNRGEPVAIVGYVGQADDLERIVSNPETIVEFDRKYFVYMSPDKELLEQLRFRFAR